MYYCYLLFSEAGSSPHMSCLNLNVSIKHTQTQHFNYLRLLSRVLTMTMPPTYVFSPLNKKQSSDAHCYAAQSITFERNVVAAKYKYFNSNIYSYILATSVAYLLIENLHAESHRRWAFAVVWLAAITAHNATWPLHLSKCSMPVTDTRRT